MYKQEPEFSDIAIAFTQFGSGLMFCLLTLIFGASLFDHFLIRLLLCIGLIVYIIYGIRKLDKIMMK
ncbi:hypothetical protein JCM9157_2908 [Halalkalibacter akibai JCM 9157]|uniref:Uncharacterized protein n=2 Tax=Halalkalibacter akibai TaxID=1411 RepID=W4QUC3_HALA3|nr:hypothetical protein JCM9157_2908 [Halalkalibacter akibai JCM 9157]